MSSKKRRAERTWMAKERECSNQRVARARVNEREEWERKLTLIVPPRDRETVYPQGYLERPYMRIFAPKQGVLLADMFEEPRHRFEKVREVTIEARQMALVLPNGGKVVWWTWELAR